MRVSSTSLRSVLIATIVLASMWTCATALAQQTERPNTSEKPEGKPSERGNQVDTLIADLLKAESEDEDLAWLYSDEYAPSRLGGRPIPAPGLPRRGQGEARVWDPRWRRFALGNYVLTVSGFALGNRRRDSPLHTRPLDRQERLRRVRTRSNRDHGLRGRAVGA